MAEVLELSRAVPSLAKRAIAMTIASGFIGIGLVEPTGQGLAPWQLELGSIVNGKEKEVQIAITVWISYTLATSV
jgi:hypothetical protein